MKTISLTFFTFLFLIALEGFAQRDTLKKYSYEKLIYDMDSLVNSSYNRLNAEGSVMNNVPSNTKTFNDAICDTLTKLLPILSQTLYERFGTTDNMTYQISPFLTSLKQNIEALREVTRDGKYTETEFSSLFNVYLFKELSKGNLFRALNSVKVVETRFTVALSMGIQSNTMNSTLLDAYSGKAWSEVNLENKNINKNLFYSLQLGYEVSDKVIVGLGFKSIASNNLYGQDNYTIKQDTIYLPYFEAFNPGISRLNYKSQSSESLNGFAFEINSDYILKKNKSTGYGTSIAIGASVQLNNYKLSRQLTTSYVDSTIMLNNVYDTAGNFIGYTEGDAISSSWDRDVKKDYSLNSISFGFHACAYYHFNKFVSLKLSLAQNIDLGASVEEVVSVDKRLPSYTIKLNSFSASAGIAIHF